MNIYVIIAFSFAAILLAGLAVTNLLEYSKNCRKSEKNGKK